MRVSVAVLVASCALLCVFGSVSVFATDLALESGTNCEYADVASSQSTEAHMATAMYCLTNQVRAHFKLPSLKKNAKCEKVSKVWVAHLKATNQFTHGNNVPKRFEDQKYNWGDIGENLAENDGTARDALKEWLASAEHCQNLLNPDFLDMGMWATTEKSGSTIYIQDFGRLINAKAKSKNTKPQNGCPYTVTSWSGASIAAHH